MDILAVVFLVAVVVYFIFRNKNGGNGPKRK